MSEAAVPGEKRMRLRYRGRCRLCERELPAESDALYERTTKAVTCLPCASRRDPGGEEWRTATDDLQRVVDPGVPGASARREYERRRAGRQQRIRSEHQYFGELLLMLSADPQSTVAWDTGARGEERLGRRLNDLASDSLRLLHDRRIPGSRANIDHLAVTRNGVFVIDSKRYQGRPRLAVEGGLIRPRVDRLVVGRRDCTKLVEGVLKQVDVVRAIVGEAAAVSGVLCFVDADWPLVGGSFTIRGAEVLWPKKLFPSLTAPGPLSVEDIGGLHRLLDEALPRAC